MPTTSFVDTAMAAASIGARTTAAAVAVDDITAEEIRLLASILTEGKVTPANSFKVAADSPASMDVKVGSGAAKTDIFAVKGDIAGQGNYLVRLEAATVTVTIGAADASQQRIDEIYLVVADAPYDGGTVSLPRIGYRKGDAGGAAPGADAAWDAFALLATITVPAAATTIVAGNIADGRGTSGFVSTIAPFLPLAGGTLTGALTLSGAPTSDLHASTKKYVDDKFTQSATVATNENTSSTSYGDLTTSGPAKTVTTGTTALVVISAWVFATAEGASAFAGFAVSGATTLAASDLTALRIRSSGASGGGIAASRVVAVSGLTAGSNTFTLKYRTSSGASVAEFSDRQIIIIPI